MGEAGGGDGGACGVGRGRGVLGWHLAATYG